MPQRLMMAAALVVALLAQVSRGTAADFAPSDSASGLPVPVGWTFRATPYAWLTSLKGSQTIKGRTANIDITFVDLARKSRSGKLGLLINGLARGAVA